MSTAGAPHWEFTFWMLYAIGYAACVVFTTRWGYRKDLEGGNPRSRAWIRTFNLLASCVLAVAWPVWWIPMGVARLVTTGIER